MRACVVWLLLLAPLGAASGGTVEDVRPAIGGLEATAPSPVHEGDAEVISGQVVDGNGEQGIATVRIWTSSGPAVASVHSVPQELPAQEPLEFAQGWKVWDPEPGDGAISFRFMHVYAASGTHSWTAAASDASEEGDAHEPVLVHVKPHGGGGGSGGGGRTGGEAPGGQTGDGGTDGGDGQDAASGPEGGDAVGPAGAGVEPVLSVDPAFDITATLQARRVGTDVGLAWTERPGAAGYQIWHFDGSWRLLDTLGPDARSFVHTDAGEGRYKLTFFHDRIASQGYVAGGEVHVLAGWDEGLFREAPQAGQTASWWWMWLLLLAMLLLARRRRHDRDRST